MSLLEKRSVYAYKDDIDHLCADRRWAKEENKELYGPKNVINRKERMAVGLEKLWEAGEKQDRLKQGRLLES